MKHLLTRLEHGKLQQKTEPRRLQRQPKSERKKLERSFLNLKPEESFIYVFIFIDSNITKFQNNNRKITIKPIISLKYPF